MAFIEDSGALFIAAFAWTAIVAFMAVLIRGRVRHFMDLGKIWSVGLNGNNGLADLSLVKPDPEGIKLKNGDRIKTELNFMFQDRKTGRRIVAFDEDSGLLMRPYDGEIEISDPAPRTAADMSQHINDIKAGFGSEMWKYLVIGGVAIAIIIGIVLIVMVSGLGGS